MNFDKKSDVLIAVREAPFRANKLQQNQSVIQFATDCKNTLVVNNAVHTFDAAFNSSVSQATLYETLVQPLVSKVLAGTNCTALAYGQTGTGKSYSMGMGAEPVTEQQMGILPRCAKDLLMRIPLLKADKENNRIPMQLFVSFLEIYNEKAHDLLSAEPQKPIAVRGQRFTGATKQLLSSLKDLQSLLELGAKKRHVRATNMNQHSSRSHAIVTFSVQRGHRVSRLNLVDLAGSEGVRRTQNEGMARDEGVFINMGLLAINKVLLSLTAGHAVIPYRESILTAVLQDSFISDAFITLLACVSPHAEDVSQTNSTLRFAKDAKRMKLSPRLSQQLQQLQAKLRIQRSTPGTVKRLQSNVELSKRHEQATCKRRVHSTPFKRRSINLTNTDETPMRDNEKKKEQQVDQHTLRAVSPHLSLLNYSNSNSNLGCIPEELNAQHNEKKKKEQQVEQHTLRPVSPHLSLLNYPTQELNAQHNVIPRRTQPQWISTLLDLSGIKRFSPSFSEKQRVMPAAVPPVRRSVRLSMRLQAAAPSRRSQRLANRTLSVDFVKPEVPPLKTASKRRTTRTMDLNGQVLEQLSETRGKLSARLKLHRSNMLRMLNSAKPEDLKALPQIGTKTAQTLLIQRMLFGSFESWTQVQKLPIWNGRWQHFALANGLEIPK
ncbi:kinesin-like protein Nod [Drosophila busckii]|uniref:kinesin-like protein Nod n=1 Tax=Drosophila busckii TaxID=30019 RepID=UPI001432B34F|nr:kinesin-like protein Nod [Drosophila busckii]